MERICTHCHAAIDLEFPGDWCPACGGALSERTALPAQSSMQLPPVIDHRGIQLPARHLTGGIITPQ